MDRTLFDNAFLNYNYAVNGYNTIGDDEMYLNLVGFNLQQALELSMKHLLKENGVRYGRTHDISQLIRLADENNVNLCVSDYIREHSEMFTAWEARSRYVTNYQVERAKIAAAIENIDKYLDDVKEELTRLNGQSGTDTPSGTDDEEIDL